MKNVQAHSLLLPTRNHLLPGNVAAAQVMMADVISTRTEPEASVGARCWPMVDVVDEGIARTVSANELRVIDLVMDCQSRCTLTIINAD